MSDARMSSTLWGSFAGWGVAVLPVTVMWGVTVLGPGVGGALAGVGGGSSVASQIAFWTLPVVLCGAAATGATLVGRGDTRPQVTVGIVTRSGLHPGATLALRF